MLLSALARNMVYEIKYNNTDLFLDIGRYANEVYFWKTVSFRPQAFIKPTNSSR